MKTGVIFFCLSLIYLGFGVFSSNINYEESIKESVDSDFYDYSGVLNVHSNRSSGSGSVQEIITAANNAELDFIVFNNENPINEKQPSPITFGNLNVFYSLELSYKNSRFLKISHLDAEVFESKSSIEISMSNALNSLSSDELIILAHPDKPGSKWEGKIPSALSGSEVINLREVWNQSWLKSKFIFLSSLIFYPFNPKLFFLKIFSSDLTSEKTLDRFNKEQISLGFLGSDATSKLRILSKTFIQFPGYKTLFSLAKNHVLLEEEMTGRKNHQKIINALKRGQNYFSLDVLGNPSGFALYTMDSKRKKLVEKEMTELKKIYIQNPKHKDQMRTLIFFNGEKYLELDQNNFFFPKEKGTYRVRVDVKPTYPLLRNSKWIPWIYSSPFKIN